MRLPGATKKEQASDPETPPVAASLTENTFEEEMSVRAEEQSQAGAVPPWLVADRLTRMPTEFEWGDLDSDFEEVDLDLDTKGWVAGLPDSEFTSPRELGDLLAKSPQCQECLVKQVFRYMAGRQDTPADRPVLTQALEEFRKYAYQWY